MFEVRVFVENGSVGPNVACRVAFLLSDGSDATGGETGGAGADEFGEAADEFEFGVGGDEREFVVEEIARLRQVLEGIPALGQHRKRYMI